VTFINSKSFCKIDIPEVPRIEELTVGNPEVLDEVLPQIEAQQQFIATKPQHHLIAKRTALENEAKTLRDKGPPEEKEHARLLDIETQLKAIPRSDAPITIKSKWDAVKMPIVSRLFGGFDFNNDNHEDFVLIRSFTIYVAKGETPQTISFVSKIMGTEASDVSGKPDAQMLASAEFMWSEKHAVSERMDAFQKVIFHDGKESIKLFFYNADKMERREVIVPSSIARSSLEEAYQADLRLYKHISEVQAYIGNSSGYFSMLRGVSMSPEEKKTAQAARDKMHPTLYSRSHAALRALKLRYAEVMGDPQKKSFYELRKPDLLPFMCAIIRDAAQYTTYTEEEEAFFSELIPQKAYGISDTAAKTFEWKGAKMDRWKFFADLRMISDPIERRELFQAYTHHHLVAMQQKDGLLHEENGELVVIRELNALARNHGFRSHADFITKVNYATSVEDVDRAFQEHADKKQNDVNAYVAELEALNGGPVAEWDVPYLTQQLISSRFGGKEIPKLSIEEAGSVAKDYLRDLGFDLDQPPFQGKIIMDLYAREGKDAQTHARGVHDGSSTVLHGNFKPGQQISLEEFNVLLHELFHNIHFILGAEKAGGKSINGFYGQPRVWGEGSAQAIANVIYEKSWMDRYLKLLPQFADDKFRAAISNAKKIAIAYEEMQFFCYAKWEINLYERTDLPVKDRLALWREMSKKYLGVETMDMMEGGYPYTRSQFSSFPIYYVNYALSSPLATPAVEAIVNGLNENDLPAVQRAGVKMRNILRAGSRLPTTADVSRALKAN